jgi:hypothetical protein
VGKEQGHRRFHQNEHWLVSTLTSLPSYTECSSLSEVIWCDFNSSAIELVNHLNVTPPRHSTLHPLHLDPGSPDAPPILPFPFFSLSSFHEWARIYTTYNMAALPFLTLHPAGMVTYYSPRLPSLVGSRLGLTMAQHRIWPAISKEDALSVRAEVEDVVQRGYGVGSGTDWISLARLIVDNWAHRIVHVRHFLSDLMSLPHSAIDITRALEEIQLLTYSPLMPYMDTTSTNATGQDLFFSASPLYPHESGLDRCGFQYTEGIPLDKMTSQERLLKESIETVQGRICLDFGTIFTQSYDLFHSDTSPIGEAFMVWLERITNLSTYLDWPTDTRCEEVCGSDVSLFSGYSRRSVFDCATPECLCTSSLAMGAFVARTSCRSYSCLSKNRCIWGT